MQFPDLSLLENLSLKPHNTLGIDHKTRYFCELNDTHQLPELALHLQKQACQYFILGGGSNIVLANDFEGLAIHINLLGKTLDKETDDFWYIKAAAGENWHHFVRWCLANNWHGLENLSLIPGTVGAAPVQNIGAYGVELAQTINQVDIYDLNTQNYFSLNKDECEFAYRHSIFKRKPHWLITHVSFALAKQRKLEYSYADLAKELAQNNIHTPTALQISDAVMHVRKRKLPDPKIIGNVGSFFKNPIISTDQLNQLITHHPQLPNYLQSDDQYKIPAAWLIEQCGFKGQSFGGAAVSKEHALVLINAASAKGSDVLALATLIQEAVQTQFQITLQMEPVIIR